MMKVLYLGKLIAEENRESGVIYVHDCGVEATALIVSPRQWFEENEEDLQKLQGYCNFSKNAAGEKPYVEIQVFMTPADTLKAIEFIVAKNPD